MNYQKIYNQLIQHRIAQPISANEYKEVHHIVPKCMNGTDDKSNLIALDPREHYIAHVLLWKQYIGTKYEDSLLSAITMMQCTNKINDRNFKFNSRLYKNIRLKFSAIRRQKWKDMPKEVKDKFRQTMSSVTKGANNGMYGKKLSDLMDKNKYIAMHKKQALTMKSLMYIVNLETKKTRRIPKNIQIPEGWIKGRTIKIS